TRYPLYKHMRGNLKNTADSHDVSQLIDASSLVFEYPLKILGKKTVHFPRESFTRKPFWRSSARAIFSRR
ncbi:MAG: hypothetical protein ACFFGZ_03335, partial [Candidatus Thorarchaeota archaeon]